MHQGVQIADIRYVLSQNTIHHPPTPLTGQQDFMEKVVLPALAVTLLLTFAHQITGTSQLTMYT